MTASTSAVRRTFPLAIPQEAKVPNKSCHLLLLVDGQCSPAKKSQERLLSLSEWRALFCQTVDARKVHSNDGEGIGVVAHCDRLV